MRLSSHALVQSDVDSSDPEDLGSPETTHRDRGNRIDRCESGPPEDRSRLPVRQSWAMWSSGLPVTTGRRSPGQRSDRQATGYGNSRLGGAVPVG